MEARRRYGGAIGGYVAKRPSFFRRLTTAAFDALPSSHNMIALVELDVTEIRKALKSERRRGGKVSLFAALIRSIAEALAENRELNAIGGRRRVYEFEEVDVNIPLEVDLAGEKTPKQVVIRNAAEKTVEQIHLEIEAARSEHKQSGSTGSEDRWAMGFMKVLLLLPAFVRRFLLKRTVGNPLKVKRLSGTTMVTSVARFGMSGFAIPYLVGARAAAFALGGLARKPVVFDRRIEIREILNMTLVFNHDLVDGAPAARFVSRLKSLVEKPERHRWTTIPSALHDRQPR